MFKFNPFTLKMDWVTDPFDPSTSSIGDFGTRTHSLLTSLTADDHIQYALLAGRVGGQTLIGGTASGNSLTLSSTAHATKGTILFGSSVYNETSNYLGLGGTPTSRLHVLGTTTSHVGKFDIGIDFNVVSPPTTPPGLALIASAGNINVGTHYYRITYVTAVGETEFNTGAGATTTYIITDAGNAQVTVTLPVSSDYRVTHVNIYRAVTGAVWWNDVKKVGQVTNGTTTFVDNIADASRTGLNNTARGNTTNRFLTFNGSPILHTSGQNTFLGYRAGEGVVAGTSTGGENTIIGASSGITLTGSKNVAIGIAIGVSASDSSVIIGHNAGGIGGSFQHCLVFGRNAYLWCTSSYSSVVIGGSAATGSTYYASNYNIAIGGGCLSSIATGASQLIVLGIEAADNITTSVGSIIMGSWVNAPSATTNGQLNIGNVLYGLGMYATYGVGSSTPTTAGQIGIGINPTGVAKLEVAAGSTTYVPFKLTSGALKTTAVAGGVEFLTDDFYATITTGTARKAFILDDGTRLTSGRVPFATTNGRLTDDADLTFAGDTLTATKFVGTTSVKVGTAAGYISSDGSTGATGTFTTSDLKTVTVKDGIITSIV